MGEFQNLQQIVDQLKSCHFVCEGGPLENSLAFMALERMANDAPLILTISEGTDVEAFGREFEDIDRRHLPRTIKVLQGHAVSVEHKPRWHDERVIEEDEE